MLDKFNQFISHPVFKSVGKLIKLFRRSKSYWTVASPIILFIISQIIAVSKGAKFSNYAKEQLLQVPLEKHKEVWWTVVEIYFENGSWLYVVLGFLLLLIITYASKQNIPPIIDGNHSVNTKKTSNRNWIYVVLGFLTLLLIISNANNQNGTIIIGDYYGVNPNEVQKLKEKLSLGDDVIKQLLNNVKEKDAELSKRTEAFELEAAKYQKLIESFSKSSLDQEVKKLLRLAKWDEAEKILEQANLKDKGKIANRDKEIAQINELKLNYPKAIEYYNKSLTVLPTDLSSWDSLARLYQLIGNTEKSLYSWQQLQHFSAQQNEWRWNTVGILGEADIHVIQGDRTQALNKYSEVHQKHKLVIKQNPNNSDWQRDLIVSYVKMSEINTNEYKKFTQKALKIAEVLFEQNSLYPEDHWIIDELKSRLSD